MVFDPNKGHDWHTMGVINRQLGNKPDQTFEATPESFANFVRQVKERGVTEINNHLRMQVRPLHALQSARAPANCMAPRTGWGRRWRRARRTRRRAQHASQLARQAAGRTSTLTPALHVPVCVPHA